MLYIGEGWYKIYYQNTVLYSSGENVDQVGRADIHYIDSNGTYQTTDPYYCLSDMYYEIMLSSASPGHGSKTKFAIHKYNMNITTKNKVTSFIKCVHIL